MSLRHRFVSRIAYPLIIYAVVTVLAAAAVRADAPVFNPLGDLAGGYFTSAAFAVSGDGSTVVGYGNGASSKTEAFRWTRSEGMVGFGLGVSGNSAVSHDGSVVVGRDDAGPYRWTASNGIVFLPSLPSYDGGASASAISADGLRVVGSSSNDQEYVTQACLWDDRGGLVGLGYLDDSLPFSRAWGISADGSTVVGRGWSSTGVEAFRWTETEGMVGLGDLPGGEFKSTAYAASEDGAVIVGASSGRVWEGYPVEEAFRWSAEEGMLPLGPLTPGNLQYMSDAFAISADGSTIVGTIFEGTVEHAFIWDADHGMRDLNVVFADELGLDLAGWNLRYATGISSDGQTIVGFGTNPSGFQEAWVAVVPEPASLGLTCAGGAFAVLRRRTLPHHGARS